MHKKQRFASSLTKQIRHFTTFRMQTFAITLMSMRGRISSRRTWTLSTPIWSIDSGASNKCHPTNGRRSSSTQPSAFFAWDVRLSSSLTCTHRCSIIIWSRFLYGCIRMRKWLMWGMSLRQSCPKSRTRKGGWSCGGIWEGRWKGRMRVRGKRERRRKYHTST